MEEVMFPRSDRTDGDQAHLRCDMGSDASASASQGWANPSRKAGGIAENRKFCDYQVRRARYEMQYFAKHGPKPQLELEKHAKQVLHRLAAAPDVS
jgi:hypothetical protein